MIIGIDASRANRPQKTGTEWYSYYLIKRLAQIDGKNQYILYTDKPLVGGLLDLCQNDKTICHSGEIKYDQDGFQIIKSPHDNFKAKVLKWKLPVFWTQGRLSWEMLVKSPDILFVPSHALPVIHPRKSIITVHDIGFEADGKLYHSDYITQGSGRSGKFLNCLIKTITLGRYGANPLDYSRWSTRYGLKKAAKIITISNFSKNEMVKYYQADPKKINVVYNGYNTNLFNTNVDYKQVAKVLAKYGIDAPYFFYIGRLEKKKNIANLVEAYAIFRDKNKDMRYKLVLVGCPGYGFDDVKYIMREYNILDDVIITGWAEENEVPYFYHGASAFVFPSNYEGFGIPLIQAMACGTPIVASDIPSIAEVVDETALLFDRQDPESIAEKMRLIVSDQVLRDKLVKKGLDRASQFSWTKCAEKTLENILDINK